MSDITDAEIELDLEAIIGRLMSTLHAYQGYYRADRKAHSLAYHQNGTPKRARELLDALDEVESCRREIVRLRLQGRKKCYVPPVAW